MEKKPLAAFLSQAVAKYHEMAIALSDDLAAHPELPDQEFRSSQKMVEILQQAGYEMEYPYLGWPTAFRGVLDNGEGPNVAIMVEYDALPGLGHACGHNVHGSMAILTALALAECKDQYQGKVYVFGTPAEEERGGKIIMADQGAFDDMAVAMMIHSGSGGVAVADMDELSLKCYLVDARRENVTSDIRFSGVILDGGKAPNIIPDKAMVRIEFRTNSMAKLERLDGIVKKCAQGAAMAMDCEVSFTLGFDPFADMVRVPALEQEVTDLFDVMGQAYMPVPDATGSSDVGNVSYRCPTIQPQFPICSSPWPLHSVEFVQEITRPAAHKAIADGAVVMANLAYRVLTDEAVRKAISTSFEESKQKKMTL